MTSLIPIPEDKVQTATKHGQMTLQRAQSLVVSNEQELEAANQDLLLIADAKKKVGGFIGGLINPFKEALKNAKAQLDPLVAPYEEADELVRGKMKKYMTAVHAEQERKAAEEKAKRDAENAKQKGRMNEILNIGFAWKAADNIFVFETLTVHPAEIQFDDDELWKEKVRKLTAEVQAIVDARPKAEEAPVEEPKPAEPLPEFVEPEPVEKPTFGTKGETGTVGTSERWTFDKEEIDLSKVPVEYLAIDSVKVNAAIRNGVREIPGLKIFKEIVPIARPA